MYDGGVKERNISMEMIMNIIWFRQQLHIYLLYIFSFLLSMYHCDVIILNSHPFTPQLFIWRENMDKTMISTVLKHVVSYI